MIYSALDLSKYIVQKCIDDNYPISNLQLQKILYYIQREQLKNDSIAFTDDIEAWQFGPVVPEVYYYFCGSGVMPIFVFKSLFLVDSSDLDWIDTIVKEKRVLKPWDMVRDVHKEGGAWFKIYNDGKGNHKTIPIDMIRWLG